MSNGRLAYYDVQDGCSGWLFKTSNHHLSGGGRGRRHTVANPLEGAQLVSRKSDLRCLLMKHYTMLCITDNIMPLTGI